MTVTYQDLTIGDVTVRYLFIARGYATREQSKRAWERINDQLRGGARPTPLAAITIKDDERATNRIPHPFAVIVYTPDKITLLRRAERLLGDGVPFALDQAAMLSLLRRRARVALDAIEEARAAGRPLPTSVAHTARVESGMQVMSDGTSRPNRRPQG